MYKLGKITPIIFPAMTPIMPKFNPPIIAKEIDRIEEKIAG